MTTADMDDRGQSRKRLTIRERYGMTVYCASAWPGWRAVTTTLVVFIIIAVILAGVLAFVHKPNTSFDGVSGHNKWLGWSNPCSCGPGIERAIGEQDNEIWLPA